MSASSHGDSSNPTTYWISGNCIDEPVRAKVGDEFKPNCTQSRKMFMEEDKRPVETPIGAPLCNLWLFCMREDDGSGHPGGDGKRFPLWYDGALRTIRGKVQCPGCRRSYFEVIKIRPQSDFKRKAEVIGMPPEKKGRGDRNAT